MTSAISGTFGHVPTYQTSDHEWEMLTDGNLYKGPKNSKGVPHGKGELKYPDSDPKKIDYVGGFDNGQRHGDGTIRWKNGYTYKGEWHGGYPHGKGVYTYKDGDIKEDDATFEWDPTAQRSIPTEGKRIFSNGNIFEGKFKDGVPYSGTLTTADGQEWDYAKGAQSNQPKTKNLTSTNPTLTTTLALTEDESGVDEEDKNYSFVYSAKSVNTTDTDEVSVDLSDDKQKKPLLPKGDEGDEECCGKCTII